MLPKHVAIIMDGNGRWAQRRGYPRFYGHIRGATRVREIVKSARELGIQALTLYAFSTENWKRPEEELNVLWKILKKYIKREVSTLKANGIRLHVIGEMERLPRDAQIELKNAIEELRGGEAMTLTFALSYGARSELIRATQAIARKCASGELEPQKIDENTIDRHLSTSALGDLSDVDLLVRTSGEQRISNFLLWQCSYAEFEFPKTLWPDYSVEEFKKSLENFKNRDRRFGGL